MQGLPPHTRRRRAQGAIGVVCLLLGGLSFTFFRTQVLREPVTESERNRLRPVAVPAPRGTILDRQGRPVAETVPTWSLSLLPAPAGSIRRALTGLAPLLELSEAQVEVLVDRRSRYPRRPLLVSPDVPATRLAAIGARRSLFPELLIEPRPKRHYPLGSATAHVLGYVGEISDDELVDPVFAGYRSGQTVGKAGVEREQERRLSGRPGMRFVEVDGGGRLVGEPSGREVLAPIPGEALRLSIDGELQEWIAGILGDTMRGAVVALEPGTGAVLALYSSPSFDPNALVAGVSPDRWRELQREPGAPLLNRVTGAGYPPGSTWKLATAVIALRLGILDPAAHLPLACRGGMQYGTRYFRCWEQAGHGHLDLADAVKHSCDVYFYQLGLQVGLERVMVEGTRLGFGARTGVDLPAEKAGRFPSDVDWYTRRFGAVPTELEVLELAAGRGPNDQTALRMAQFYAAVATDGRVAAPRVALGGAPPADTLDLRVQAGDVASLRAALARATAEGSSTPDAQPERWSWIGVPGPGPGSSAAGTGWFVGIGGLDETAPEVVVAAVIESADGGSTAARVAARTADYYLRRRHAPSGDTVRTESEHETTARAAPPATH